MLLFHETLQIHLYIYI